MLPSRLRTAAQRLPIGRIQAAQPLVSAAQGSPALRVGDRVQEQAVILQLGPAGVMVNSGCPTTGWNAPTVDFGLASMHLQVKRDKEQGGQGTGDLPAENPRNDVPPVGPDNRDPSTPPSPDKAETDIDRDDFNKPGTQEGRSDHRLKPDMGNANPAVTQKAGATDLHLGTVAFHDAQPALRTEAQAEMRTYVDESDIDLSVTSDNRITSGGTPQQVNNVYTKPVETLLETPLDESIKPSDDGTTGPQGQQDNPPGTDVDPNLVPPPKADDNDDTDTKNGRNNKE